MTDIKKIKGAIFDLDGTILDSMFIWSEIGYKFLEKKNIHLPAGADEQFTTMSLMEAAEYYIKHFDNTATIEGIVADINSLVEDFYFNEVLKKPGIEEFLEFLKNRGVKMCVATATDKYMVEKALERNGLLHYFSEIYTCNGVGAGKNSSLIYDISLEHLGTTKEETFVFEDSYHAVATASKAGYNVIAISDKSASNDEEKIKKLSLKFIENYAELDELFCI